MSKILQSERISNFTIDVALREKIGKRFQSDPEYFNLESPHLFRAKQILNNVFPNSQSKVIIDIGAGDGTISEEIVSLFKCNNLHAFEPQKNQYEKLSKKSLTIPSITPYHCALGSSPNKLELNINHNIGSSSFHAKNSSISNNYYNEKLSKEKTELVEVKTLDSFNFQTDIDLIKVDIQGFEIEALKGALNTLKKTKLVLIEMQNHDFYVDAPKYYEIDAFMRQVGFDFCFHVQMSRSYKIHRELEWDALYINQDLSTN
ncbi:FkbM family methyltransferase [Salibacteraceae bacterium]|nr:FkbM family methyltransferase [Salibacteraceae bacterium]